METLSSKTQATCLLCAHTGKDPVPPLAQKEYVQVRAWLREVGIDVEALLEPDVRPLLSDMQSAISVDAERIAALLQRGVQLAMWLERWLNAGMWVLSWDDPMYPSVLRRKLGEAAPMLLHGFGSSALMQEGGIAIVGSRRADSHLLETTRHIANQCARESWNVVSGGAQGVDRAAMLGALEEYGTCVGVLPADLARVASRPELREPLLTDKLCLVSPYHPQSGFSVGNAMGRNKIIYALADHALVIACEYKKGGTWAGAVESLKAGWTPVFIYTAPGAPNDNLMLLKEGALSLPPLDEQPFRKKLDEAVAQMSAPDQPAPQKRSRKRKSELQERLPL